MKSLGLKIKRWFTLIELLVVIAVIAILASLLLPALKRAKEQSLKSVCTNRMKQVGLAVENYRNDFDDWYPPQQGFQTGSGGFPWPGTYNFESLILPYFGAEPAVLNGANDYSKNILLCPASGYQVGMNLTETRKYARAPGMGRVYNYWTTSIFGFSYNIGWGYYPKKRIQSSHSPSEIILSVEVPYNSRPGYATGGGITKCLYKHFNQTNLLLLDGHVASYPYAAALDMAGYNLYFK